MSFQDKLKEKFNDDNEILDLLPKKFQRVGDIIILTLDEKLKNYEKKIGEKILEMFPGVKSVCVKDGGIIGEFRKPQIRLIFGNENTKTVHSENGCFYVLDVKKVMFAKGNVSERVRISEQIKTPETILDMFAGIGYFSIPIGKLSPCEKIYSIELNPESFEFLKEGLIKNKITEKVIAINGDSKIETEKLINEYGRFADRVLLGYLPPPVEFLPYAMRAVKRGGVIHYEDLVKVDEKEKEIDRVMKMVDNIAKKEGFEAELLLAKKIKGYAPKIDHYVFDIKVV